MALENVELFGGPTTKAQTPRMSARALKVVKFASGSALLPVGTPVVYDTSANTWKPYVQAGANETNVIRAFLYERPLQLSGTGEQLGVVLIRGEVYAPDVNTAATRAVMGGSPSAANVDTALRTNNAAGPTLRELGIDIRGLTQVR